MPLSDEVVTALTDAGYTLYERPRGHRPRRRLRGHQAARRRLPGRSGAHVRTGHRQAVGRRRREAFEGPGRSAVSRKAGDDMRLRCADFASGTIEKAVPEAMQVEGWKTPKSPTAAWTTPGNTYQAGVVSTDNGAPQLARVGHPRLDRSATSPGLPNTAFYVGIRFPPKQGSPPPAVPADYRKPPPAKSDGGFYAQPSRRARRPYPARYAQALP